MHFKLESGADSGPSDRFIEYLLVGSHEVTAERHGLMRYIKPPA